ncbi:MAG TPA: maleylpyruvate isomerase family mycothiol-dependent enzyme [Geodermatophilus sp.]|nr:maleylpyruvate isomerase family mycothiol-dependent enzyme [Geodermatophilus sp.]
MSTVTPVRAAPRSSAFDRATAMRLAATEYDRFLDQLRDLDEEDWTRPTDCPAWDVRAIAGHVLGEAEGAGSVREFVRQFVATARAGGGVDAYTALQVREHAGLTPGEVVDRFAAAAPRAVRGRRRVPGPVRRLPIPDEQVVGSTRERWTVGFLLDTIFNRDPWMHRIDIARATGRPLELTADHDGVLVADIVAEWAGRHGRPYRLRLTGPAGGTWTSGDGGEDLELDAVEFCRLLSGRGAATGLLAQPVPF